MTRRTLLILLSVLGTILLGTTILLTSISLFLRIDASAYLTEEDIPWPDPPDNVSSVPLPGERIPRILHQTWKEETLPEKWASVSEGCRELMPDYAYMLWTDAASRSFIEEHYPWFLLTFDGYPYPIMRADAIRYFVLYHYGGTYLDLDVGCKRRLDRLLSYPAVLPKTIPVGVSNDLMLSAPRHPFMRRAIDSLQSFDHTWMMNYPTVMFSTGPMFISSIYGLYTSVSGYPRTLEGEVRVLPKSLYGKNASPEEAPHAFFEHYYGSSWHSDDAGLVLFLGSYGTLIMYISLFVLVAGAARLLLLKLRAKHRTLSLPLSRALGSPTTVGRWRRLGRSDILPRIYTDSTGRHLELGGTTFSLPSSATSSPYASWYGSPGPSPTESRGSLHLSSMDLDQPAEGERPRWAKRPSRVLAHLSFRSYSSKSKTSSRTKRSLLFLLPDILRPAHPRSSPRTNEGVHTADEEDDDIGAGYDDVPLIGGRVLSPGLVGSPPPYDSGWDDGLGDGEEELGEKEWWR